ncbi:MAG: metal-dependent hydrolase [Phycisphaerae bacterium]
MDTITHGLLGAAVAQLGFRQRIGRDATWAAVIACVIPDLDIFIAPLMMLTGTEENGFAMMTNHRGISHSLLMVPLLSLVVTIFWWWFKRKTNSNGQSPLWFLFLCVFTAMLSHPLLDWCTTYGTQLFSPITNHRFALDAVPIIDIFYTPILILTLLACYIARRIRTDARKATLIIGWIGFGLSAAYLTAGLGLNRIATAAMQEPLSECKAYPQIGSIFVWRVTHRCPESWSVGKINILFDSNAQPSKITCEKIIDNEWIRRARELPEVKLFNWFAMGQLRVTYLYHNSRQIVEFHDMRYGIDPQSLDSLWSVRATFDESTRTSAVEYIQHHHGANLRQILRRTWRDMWNP